MVPNKSDIQRSEQDDLVGRLRQFQAGIEMQTLIKVLDYRLRQVQFRLLDCALESLGQLQGEARAYTKLLRDLRSMNDA
jgi:hypothetical protein